MNRQIKFRIWDLKNKSFVLDKFNDVVINYKGTMVEWDFYYEYYKERREIPNEAILQQFTGVLDKNGKDIFEGDILLYDKYNCKYEVIWYEPDNAWRLKQIDNNNVTTTFKGWANYMLVIGNIYKNPELLK